MKSVIKRMDAANKKTDELTEGLTPVDPELFADFKRAMTDDVIPKIVEAVEERRMKAAESRQWQLKY